MEKLRKRASITLGEFIDQPIKSFLKICKSIKLTNGATIIF